ncbi:MAG: radical SAM protein, partial [Desulfosarcinaceae bacterium]
HIHLPVQSGSNAVLKRMNRHYTVGHYLEKVERLKRACPDIALTSDIIVGFPGETASDFNATLDLMRRVEFDGLFAFIYSDRPNAPAARFGGKVDEEVKKDRLQQILNCQEEISRRRNKALVGTVQKVLVDGVSRSNSGAERRSEDPGDIKYIQWAGRTQSNRIVHFNSDNGEDRQRQVLTGRMMDIMIEKALPHCLWGQPLSP